MSVECKSVILVGVPTRLVTWDNLTSEVQDEIVTDVIHNSPCGVDRSDFVEQAKELFNRDVDEYMGWFGIDAKIGSCWTGDFYYYGIEVDDISLNYTYKDEIEKFKRVFNLEPDLHHGTYWY